MTEKNSRFAAACCGLFLSAALHFAVGAGVGVSEADGAARGWLRRNGQPLGTAMSTQIDSLRAVAVEGRTLFYIVNLSPTGFMVVSADNQLEPVVAFSDTGRFSADPDSPLYRIAVLDLSNRLRHVKKNQAQAGRNRTRWNSYTRAHLDSGHGAALSGSVSELRVDPMLQSLWGQGNVGGLPCYNYYVPPPGEPDGDPNNNIRCGCVATAMAQIMRYHQHPQNAVGVSAYTITVNGASRTAYTRGGDGLGGPYHWYLMPLVPETTTTESQRQAIGALCHDAGLTVNMSYSNSGSGAAMRKIHSAFKTFFGYSCAYYGIGSYDLPGTSGKELSPLSMPTANLNQMMNPGLDAGYPSIIGIDGPYAGHAVVVDGYGCQDHTLYHHLNMGWYGRDNAWYALPDVNSVPAFSVVDACIYNIFPYGSGEIISGRVLDYLDAPVNGALVTASLNGLVFAYDYTNERGIYALEHLPSKATYTVLAQKHGFSYAPKLIYAGISTSQGEPGMTGITGNVWGVDFRPADLLPPIALEPNEPYIVDANSLTITLGAADDGRPSPPGKLTFIIETLPSHGILYDPNFGSITVCPHIIHSDANSVVYAPCGYYRGVDSFTFKVNDGGTPPTGGDSNTATILLDVSDRQIGSTDVTSAYPFHTTSHDCRMQVIYSASEIGEPFLIGGLWMNFVDLPGSPLQNFTMRMQPTPMSEYPPEKDFVNSGWTTVYRNDETVTLTGWYRFDFETPYDCNEPNNILLDISFDNSSPAACDGTVYGFSDPNRVLVQVSNSLHGDPLQWTASMFAGSLSQDTKPAIRLVRLNPDVSCADFDTSCRVDLQDLLLLADRWLAQYPQAAYDRRYDIGYPADAMINMGDFAKLASEWIRQQE